MPNRFALRLSAFSALAAAVVLVASPARAQYRPRPLNDPATGEKYHIEAGVGLWYPTAEIGISSTQFNLVGTNVNFKNDLGLTDQRFPEFQLVLRPTKGAKFRFQYIPIKYDQSATLSRPIVFNGQRFNVGQAVNSTLDWKAYRFGFEYDFVVKNRGFAGFIVEAKYTDVRAALATEFARARAPIPAIGGIARGYVLPNISITADITGFKLPDTIVKGSSGHYVDVDVYGTLNFTNNIGAQVGYRSFDVGYIVQTDTGNLTLKGLYFGAVARF